MKGKQTYPMTHFDFITLFRQCQLLFSSFQWQSELFYHSRICTFFSRPLILHHTQSKRHLDISYPMAFGLFRVFAPALFFENTSSTQYIVFFSNRQITSYRIGCNAFLLLAFSGILPFVRCILLGVPIFFLFFDLPFFRHIRRNKCGLTKYMRRSSYSPGRYDLPLTLPYIPILSFYNFRPGVFHAPLVFVEVKSHVIFSVNVSAI